MIGTLAGSAALGRTLTGQPDNRLTLYGMIPKAFDDTNEAVELMLEVVALMNLDVSHAEAKLNHSFALATDLAEVLVLESGLSFREAHHLVGYMVSKHLAIGNFQNLTAEEITDCAKTLLGRRIELTAFAFSHALNPASAVAARDQPGGAASESITNMITRCREILQEAGNWSEKHQNHLKNSDEFLEQSINAYLTSISAS